MPSTDPASFPLDYVFVPSQGGHINDDGELGNGAWCITTLTQIIAQKSSENEMWNMYLDEVEGDDKCMTDAWKQDAKGILVFVSLNLLALLFVSMTGSKTGLFSATVDAFIIEYYKKLTPDPNTANQSSSPSTSMIWVNALWLISFEVSLTSALIATLLQQWAREYVETPKSSIDFKYRARVRSLLFQGTKLYKISLLVGILPTLIHLSVYLFFGGLMITFHTINKKVAVAVDASVGFFGLAYIALTILPCIDVRCPFRTPMSRILWYPWHTFLFLGAVCLQCIVGLLRACLGQQSTPVAWFQTLEDLTRKHRRNLMDGLGKSTVNHAGITLEDGDQMMVTGLFSRLALGDKGKFLKFMASIPRHRTIDLIPPIESGENSFQEPLLALLRSSAAGTGPTRPNADVRKRSLLVCLDIIQHIAEAPSIPDLYFVRVHLANIGLMRALWRDSDTTIRVISRSICALIARQVLRIYPLGEADQRWLQEVIGETSNRIYNAEVVIRDQMNLNSFVYGVFSGQVDDLSTEDALCFKKTLAILLDVRTDPHFASVISRDRLSTEVRRNREDARGRLCNHL
jgi:uncharacterized protein DUF6535